MRHKHVFGGMQQPAFRTATGRAIVARIFAEDRRIRELREKAIGSLAEQVGAETLAISGGALSKTGILV